MSSFRFYGTIYSKTLCFVICHYCYTNLYFSNCDATKGKRLIDCNKPEQEKKYTVLFQDTNPSPYGLEFTPGVTYYYICKYKIVRQKLTVRPCSHH